VPGPKIRPEIENASIQQWQQPWKALLKKKKKNSPGKLESQQFESIKG